MKDINDQIKDIQKLAEEQGSEKNVFFRMSFEKLIFMNEVLNKLMQDISDNGVTTTKEYIKGRNNQYVSPSLNAYNKTLQNFNALIKTCMRILRESTISDEDEDDLLIAINGIDDEE